jgi:ABC-type oligopeptide transport system substrate-binding subunit
MTRTLRIVLIALLVIGLVVGGAGAAAAENADTATASDSTTVINDDGFDSDNSFNNISTNVLGGQLDDSVVNILS